MTEQHSDASEVMGIMRALHSGVHRQVRKFLQPLNLTIPQYRTLVHITRHADDAPVSLGDLSKHLHVACSTASGIVDRLERDKWVKRARKGTDRRKIQIVPTVKARKIVGQEIVTLESYWGMLLASMDGRQRKATLGSLRHLRDVAEDLSLHQDGRNPEPGREDRRSRENLRNLWREEIGAIGRYFVATQLAQGNPEVVAHLRQMAGEKVEHAVQLRDLMGRSGNAKQYMDRLERHAERRKALMADVLSDEQTRNEMADFLRRIGPDEERHQAWLRKIRKMLG